MEISQEEYSQLKTKAEKWDKLDAKIGAIYNGDEDTDDEEAGLDVIGELAASAFGYL